MKGLMTFVAAAALTASFASVATAQGMMSKDEQIKAGDLGVAGGDARWRHGHQL